MTVKIIGICIDDQSIDSGLWIDIDIEFFNGIEAPISIAGRLILNGRVISNLNESQIINETELDLIVFDHKTSNDRINAGNKYRNRYSARLSTTLTQKAIDYIEVARDRHPEKSVDFQVEFILKTIVLSFKPVGIGGPQNNDIFSSIKVTKPYEYFSIKQSDWVGKYSHRLGIGSFLLLELMIPNGRQVREEWVELYDRLLLRAREMQNAIRQGDWQKCMFAARQYYENLTFNQKFQVQKDMKDSLKQLFFDDQHSQQGFDQFYTAVISLFGFTSKFIHDKNNTDGLLNSLPIPHKEDAYFAYSLAIGTLNVIGKKVSAP